MIKSEQDTAEVSPRESALRPDADVGENQASTGLLSVSKHQASCVRIGGKQIHSVSA